MGDCGFRETAHTLFMFLLHDLAQHLHNSFGFDLHQAGRHFAGLCGLIVAAMAYSIFQLTRRW